MNRDLQELIEISKSLHKIEGFQVTDITEVVTTYPHVSMKYVGDNTQIFQCKLNGNPTILIGASKDNEEWSTLLVRFDKEYEHFATYSKSSYTEAENSAFGELSSLSKVKVLLLLGAAPTIVRYIQECLNNNLK
jgi:hypothetical protein